MILATPAATSDVIPNPPGDEYSPIVVVPIPGVGSHGSATLRLCDPRAARRAAGKLEQTPQVCQPRSWLDELALSTIDPVRDLDPQRLLERRTAHGWAHILTARMFTPLLTPALANDRFVDRQAYLADPGASREDPRLAMPLPLSHPSYAQIVYRGPSRLIRDGLDHSFTTVLADNRQHDIGRDIVHRPLLAVATAFDPGTGAVPQTETSTVDGSSRLSTALDTTSIQINWLPARLREPYRDNPDARGWRRLTPSLLVQMTFDERRELCRTIVKYYERRLAQPATATAQDRAERDTAAAALNAMTIPVEVIVGYTDDDPLKGMIRFAEQVRFLLVRMNVGVKPLSEPAQRAISAEQLVSKHSSLFEGRVDLLLGRSNPLHALTELGLDPKQRDLRAALVVHTFTRNTPALNKALRDANGAKKAILAHRSQVIGELALRSYSTLSADVLAQARNAIGREGGGGVVWQDLVDKPWMVDNVADDHTVDQLCAKAHAALTGSDNTDPGPAGRLLGVLGVFALLTTDGLLAPSGSSEAQVGGAVIDRSSAGGVVDKLTRLPWGLDYLAVCVKRARRGELLPLLEVLDGEIRPRVVEGDSTTTVSLRNAQLRYAVRLAHDGRPDATPADQEQRAFRTMLRKVREAADSLYAYQDQRSAAGVETLVPWESIQQTMLFIDDLKEGLTRISTPRPWGGRQ